VLSIPELNLSVHGWSRAGWDTGFCIPELRVFFDCQVSTTVQPKTILITHSHTDHTLWLPNRLDTSSCDPIIMAPTESVGLIESFVDSAFRMGRGEPQLKTHFKFVGVSPGEIRPLTDDTCIRVHDLCHTVPTRAYGLVAVRKVLRIFFVGRARDLLQKRSRSSKQSTRDWAARK
jgi:ribonuclease Z